MGQKVDYFPILSRLSTSFGAARNRQELLDLLFQTAIETLEARAACLYLASPGKTRLTPVAQKGLSASYFRSPKSALRDDLIPRLQEKGFFYCKDAAADPGMKHPEVKKAEGLAAILGLPVIVRGEIAGIFCIFTDKPRDFSPAEREFLSVLAQDAGGVMAHGRLRDEVRQETRLFLNLAAKINSSLEIKQILRSLTAEIAKFFKVKAASIRLLDEDKQTLELVASFGLRKKYLNKGPATADKGINEALAGKTVVVRDASRDKQVQYRQEKMAEGIVSILSVPMKTREKVIGVLRLYTGAPRDFTANDIDLATALAHLGSLAIQNASLYLMCQTDLKDLQDELWSHRSWF